METKVDFLNVMQQIKEVDITLFVPYQVAGTKERFDSPSSENNWEQKGN